MMHDLLELDNTLSDMEVRINSVYSILKLLGSWAVDEPFLKTDLCNPIITGCELILDGILDRNDEACTTLNKVIDQYKEEHKQWTAGANDHCSTAS